MLCDVLSRPSTVFLVVSPVRHAVLTSGAPILAVQVPFAIISFAILVPKLLVCLAFILSTVVRLHFWFCTSQINSTAVEVCLLHVLDEMLRNSLVIVCHKAEASTCISAGVFDNLHFLYATILAEKATKFILSQMVLEATYEDFVACSTACPLIRAPSVILTAISVSVAATAATSSAFPLPLSIVTTLAIRRINSFGLLRY